jgi:Protein of unknown function (DUF4231)
MVDDRPVTGSADGAARALQGTAAGGEPQPAKKKKKKKKVPRKHWPALLVRWPRLRRYPPDGDPWKGDWPVVEPAWLTEYQLLAPDLTVWCEQVEARFRRLDHQAQILQNQFWRQRVTLIAGGLVATSLATVQAAMGGGKVYLAVPQAGLTGLLAGLTVLVRSRRAQHGYLSARLKAERIKSEFFLFLTQAAPYAGGDRVTRLLQEVGDIEAAEGIV